MQQTITPCLWFDHVAQEAVDYYLTVFPNSKIIQTSYYPETGLADFQKEFAGKPLAIDVALNGQKFMALNAGSEFTFNESVSFVINCKDQAEIDHYWSKLSAVPEFEQCGWCKDKFGVSWQVTPENIGELISKEDGFAKMSEMKKIVIADF
jgi:predicted 3-demethylubiquinone-9 3-methyltransferase (glyoxalase superfamily)